MRQTRRGFLGAIVALASASSLPVAPAEASEPGMEPLLFPSVDARDPRRMRVYRGGESLGTIQLPVGTFAVGSPLTLSEGVTITGAAIVTSPSTVDAALREARAEGYSRGYDVATMRAESRSLHHV